MQENPVFGVPKKRQNLASKALTLKLLFDGCPDQRAAAKNRKKHKDKGVDGQRPGLKSRTFDDFGGPSSLHLFYIKLHNPQQPLVQESPFWGPENDPKSGLQFFSLEASL